MIRDQRDSRRNEMTFEELKKEHKKLQDNLDPRVLSVPTENAQHQRIMVVAEAADEFIGKTMELPGSCRPEMTNPRRGYVIPQKVTKIIFTPTGKGKEFVTKVEGKSIRVCYLYGDAERVDIK
jgi:hypothetical protein